MLEPPLQRLAQAQAQATQQCTCLVNLHATKNQVAHQTASIVRSGVTLNFHLMPLHAFLTV